MAEFIDIVITEQVYMELFPQGFAKFADITGPPSGNASLVAFVTALLDGRILLKTAAQWTADNTVLTAGQIGIATDTGIIKLGDGVTAWNALGNAITFSKLGGAASDNSSLVSFVKNPRVLTIASAANPTLDVDLYDILYLSAQATDLTSITVTGTLSPFRPIIVVIKDNGLPRNLAFGPSFVAIGEALPTITTANKVTTVALLYYPSHTKLGCVGVKTEA